MSQDALSALQKEVLAKVVRRWARLLWFRAERAGQRVTLASLYRQRLLERRARRGREGEADAAYEYRPSDALLEAIRSMASAKEGG